MRLITGLFKAARMIYIGDVERRFVNKLRFDELKEHELIRCMKVGTPREMQEVINTYLMKWRMKELLIKTFRSMCLSC